MPRPHREFIARQSLERAISFRFEAPHTLVRARRADKDKFDELVGAATVALGRRVMHDELFAMLVRLGRRYPEKLFAFADDEAVDRMSRGPSAK